MYESRLYKKVYSMIDPQNSSLIKFSNPCKRRQVNRKRFGPILNQTNHVGSKIDTKRLAVSLPPLAGEGVFSI